METHAFLWDLVQILLFAKIFGNLAKRLHIPSVLGELCAGIVIGPSLLHQVAISFPIEYLAQIGIILLLFEVGMEADIRQLQKAGFRAFLVAMAGVILPFAGGFFVSYSLFDCSLLSALFVGCALTATSIGITLRVLQDLSQDKTKASHIILGAAVLDDILGIILLSILYDFSITGVVSAFSIAKNLALICLFSVVTPIFVRYFALTIKKWEKNAAIYAACSALFFAFIATKIGAPELLGGFLAGLGFSSRFLPLSYGLFRHKLQEQIHPVTHFFTPIFFVSIGLKLNLTLIHWGSSFIWVLTGALLFVAIFGKALSGLFAPGGLFSKSLVGIAMIPRGEVGLIFAAMGLSAGIYQEEIYAALILVITLTTLIAPLFLRVLLRLCKKY